MIEQEPVCGVRTHFYHDARSYDMLRDRRVVEASHTHTHAHTSTHTCTNTYTKEPRHDNVLIGACTQGWSHAYLTHTLTLTHRHTHAPRSRDTRTCSHSSRPACTQTSPHTYLTHTHIPCSSSQAPALRPASPWPGAPPQGPNT